MHPSSRCIPGLLVVATLGAHTACAPHIFAERSADCDGNVRIVADEEVIVRVDPDASDGCSIRTESDVRPYDDDGVLVVEYPYEVLVTGASSLEVVFDGSLSLSVVGQSNDTVGLDGTGIFTIEEGVPKLEACNGCAGWIETQRPTGVQITNSTLSMCAPTGAAALTNASLELWVTGAGDFSVTGEGSIQAWLGPGSALVGNQQNLDVQVGRDDSIECGRPIEGDTDTDTDADTDADADADTDSDCDFDIDIDFDVSPANGAGGVDARKDVRIDHPGFPNALQFIDLYVANTTSPVPGAFLPQSDHSVFAPSAPLPPATSFEGYAVDQCQEQYVFGFTTSGIGTPLQDPSLIVGQTYELVPDLIPAVGSVDLFGARGVVFQVQEAPSSGQLPVRFGALYDEVQDFCVPTVDVPMNFSNPWFDVALQEPLHLGPIRLLGIDGGFDANGIGAEHVHALVEIDISELDDPDNMLPADPCPILEAQTGVPCMPCTSTGDPTCWVTELAGTAQPHFESIDVIEVSCEDDPTDPDTGLFDTGF